MTATVADELATERITLRRVLLRPSVAVVAAVGLLVRIWVLASPLGVLNGDEAYTGLQAAEITRGHFPVVIGGAAYTGTLDTYVLAPLVWLFGQRVFLLKWMSPVLWAAASVVAVGAARRILPDSRALLCGALLWLSPGALMLVSTRGYVAYGLGMGLVMASMWAAFVVVEPGAPSRRSVLVFGALVGLAFYTHPMFTAVVAPIAVVVGTRHRRSVKTVVAPALAAALAMNVPFLLWNARNSWPSLHQPPIATQTTYLERLRGFFVGLLPRDLGMRRLNGEWMFGRPVAGLVVVGVLGLAVAGAVSLVRRSRWTGAVVAAPLVACWPLLACLNNLGDISDGRYGIVAFPVLAISVAAGVGVVVDRLPAPTLGLVAACWVLLLTVPFVDKEAGRTRGDPNEQTNALIAVLEAEGFDRVAGNYFAVLPIEYLSDARIRVAIAGNPYVIRLPHTQRLVDATPSDRLAYVFAPGPIGPTWVKLPVEQYRQVPVGGYVVYIPT